MQYKKNEIFQYIENFINDYKENSGGTAPTTYEIAAAVGISQSSVAKYMKVMRENGTIDYAGSRHIETERSRREQGAVCDSRRKCLRRLSFQRGRKESASSASQ